MRCDENGKQLQPEDFHFRAGVRQSLDIQFLQVMATRPSDVNKSDFIKQAVVEWYKSKQQRQEEISEAERVRRDLEAEIRRLEELIRSGAGVVVESSTTAKEALNDQVKIKEAEEKVKALTDAF